MAVNDLGAPTGVHIPDSHGLIVGGAGNALAIRGELGSEYDVVVDNYNGPEWLLPVKADLVEYLQNGGGMVVIHGANNAFPNWEAFNDIIGLGWRKAPYGKAIKFDEANAINLFEDLLRMA